MSAGITATGAALAATGVAHFVRPEAFDALTATAFPTNTRRHVYLDGGIETALGVALAVPRTRKLAIAGLVAYAGWLGFSAVRARR